jgi:hypothetical protein
VWADRTAGANIGADVGDDVGTGSRLASFRDIETILDGLHVHGDVWQRGILRKCIEASYVPHHVRVAGIRVDGSDILFLGDIPAGLILWGTGIGAGADAHWRLANALPDSDRSGTRAAHPRDRRAPTSI